MADPVVGFGTVLKVGGFVRSLFGRGSGPSTAERLRQLPTEQVQAEARDAERAALRRFDRTGRVNVLGAGKAFTAQRVLAERGVEFVLNPIVQAAVRGGVFGSVLRRRPPRTRDRPDRGPIPQPPRQNLPGENLPVPAGPRPPPQGPPKPPRQPPPGGVPEPPGGIPPWVYKAIGADATIRIGREIIDAIRRMIEGPPKPPEKPLPVDRDMTPAEIRAERAGEPPIVKFGNRQPEIVIPEIDVGPVPTSPTFRVPVQRGIIGQAFQSPLLRAILPGLLTAAGVRTLSRPAPVSVNLAQGFLPGASILPQPLPLAQAFAGDGGALTPVDERVAECIRRCEQPRKRRRRRKRTVCYEGTYRETARGQRKLRRREVPCE